MHFSVNRNHRQFFQKNLWIELEELLTPDQQEKLFNEIKNVLASRLTGKINLLESSEMFAAGRDVWRSSALLKKMILNKNLAEVASELIEHKPLRFGYDQFFPGFISPDSVSSHPSLDLYSSFLKKTQTLEEISCIQGVLCGLMLCLSHEPSNTIQENESAVTEAATGESVINEPVTTIFSKKSGNGVIFSPQCPIPFEQLLSLPDYSYLLIVYTQANALYCVRENDPHMHDFKRLGYNYGDRLSESLNPLVHY